MKQLIWLFLFILILFGGDQAGGFLLQRLVDQSQFRYSRMYRGEAASDILLLGNSRGLIFYEPYIEQITGHKTFNISYNGLPIDAARALSADYLDRYAGTRLLLIDITICDRENDALLSGFLSYTTHSPRLDALIRQKDRNTWNAGKVSALFRFNNEIFQRALFHRKKSDKDWLLDRVIDEKLAADAQNQSYDLDIHPYLLEQLKETVLAAQQKGVTVRLVISPYFPGFTVKNLDVLKATIEKMTGLPVHDYRNALQDPGMFGDYMHPNKKGAEAYLDLLQRDSVLSIPYQ
ncbi:MAG: hypothetical protein WCR52_03020 [Bacteroidota bacterium]